MKRAKKYELKKLIHQVLDEVKEANSLTLLIKLIRKKIKEQGKNITFSPKRVKSIIFEDESIEVVAHTSSPSFRGMEVEEIKKCPICGHKNLKKIYVIDLNNTKKVVALKCMRCGYYISNNKPKVLRYEIRKAN